MFCGFESPSIKVYNYMVYIYKTCVYYMNFFEFSVIRRKAGVNKHESKLFAAGHGKKTRADIEWPNNVNHFHAISSDTYDGLGSINHACYGRYLYK